MLCQVTLITIFKRQKRWKYFSVHVPTYAKGLCFALRLALVLLTAADKKFRYPTIDNPKISINRKLRGSLYFTILSTGSTEQRILYFGHQLLCLLAFLHHTYTKVGKQWREKECDGENGAELSCDKFNASVCPGRC
jgi:hypothetical protein